MNCRFFFLFMFFCLLPLSAERITILPNKHIAKKGDLVTFTYAIHNLQDDAYFVKWSGLPGRKYEKKFIINTANLTEGRSYIIYAQNKGKKAKAILYIKKAPQAAIKYQAYINADKKNIIEGSNVIFRARVKPSLSHLKYQFVYGDGSSSNWSTNAQSSHKYLKSDKYKVYVKAKHYEYNPLLGEHIGGNSSAISIKRSSIIPINVKVKPKPKPKPQPILIKYKLFMKASSLNIIEGESIDFSFFIQPRNQDVKYKFDFGNGKKTKWSSTSSYSKRYSKKRIYYPSVHARIGRNHIEKQSIKIIVNAKEPIVPIIEDSIPKPLKVSPPLMVTNGDYTFIFPGGSITLNLEKLSILGIVLLAILLALKSVFSVLRETFEKPEKYNLTRPKALIKFKLKSINQDDIVHKIEIEPTTQSFKVRFIPIKDNGKHKIEEEEQK